MAMSSDVKRGVRAITYCSFADDTGCLGVCVLDNILDPIQASRRAWTLEINPGGELLAVPCRETDSDVPLEIFEAMWNNRNRLIPTDEARNLFEAKSVRELES